MFYNRIPNAILKHPSFIFRDWVKKVESFFGCIFCHSMHLINRAFVGVKQYHVIDIKGFISIKKMKILQINFVFYIL
jgi:hypothetical protein